MCAAKRSWAAALGLLGILLAATAARGEDRVPVPLNGQIIVDYSKLNPAFPGKSGVFRNLEPPQAQFIAEDLVTQKLPGGAALGFLQLSYIVKGLGAFNGYWWQYPKGKAGNWSRFDDGKLVLRLAMGTHCTPRFKFELKTAARPNGPVDVFPVYVWLADRAAQKAMKETGYADVAIAMKGFQAPTFDRDSLELVTTRPNLKQVTEFTVVFEQNQIPAGSRKGILLINSIRLVNEEAGK